MVLTGGAGVVLLISAWALINLSRMAFSLQTPLSIPCPVLFHEQHGNLFGLVKRARTNRAISVYCFGAGLLKLYICTAKSMKRDKSVSGKAENACGKHNPNPVIKESISQVEWRLAEPGREPSCPAPPRPDTSAVQLCSQFHYEYGCTASLRLTDTCSGEGSGSFTHPHLSSLIAMQFAIHRNTPPVLRR